MSSKKIALFLTCLVLLAGGVVAGFLMGRSGQASRSQEDPAKQLWTCSMHPQVLQDKPGTCPICGMKLTPVRGSSKDKPGPTSSGERQIRYWWDPMMKPPFISDKPGQSPMGMDLVPVYEDEVRAGPMVSIDPVLTQNIGVRVATVVEGPLVFTVRTVGFLREAESNQHDITLKVDGWIERLHADTEGMTVRKGDPLFDLYSPDLLVAQEELLVAQRALKRLPANADDQLSSDAARLVEGARKKLELWNVPKEAIDEILRTGKSTPTVTFRSPADGYVVEKMIVQGSAVESRMKLLRIVDPSVLWMDAQIYERQIPQIKKGQKGRVSVQGRPEGAVEGEVIFVTPQVSAATRTAVARIAIPNPELLLKPGMYATVELPIEASSRALLVPREAVIDTGVRQIAFVALPGGHFEPRIVRMGLETGDGNAQILAGLAPGERVVTSGQFLLDSESRMQEAIQKLTGDRLLQPPVKGGTEKKPDAPPPTVSKARSDSVVAPYLEIARELAADRPAPTKSVDKLVEAAGALAKDAGEDRKAVEAVGDAASALRDKELKDQRQAFKKVSAALIEVVGKIATTTAVAPKLYVVHCPMAEAHWLQSSEAVANPYFGSEMLECGEVTKAIEAVKP